MKSEKILGMVVFVVAIMTMVMVFSSFTGAAPASNGTIGYVDMDRLQNELPDFQRFREQAKDKKTEFDMYRVYLYQSSNNQITGINEKATQDKNGKSPDEQAAIDKKAKEDIQKIVDDVKTKMDQKTAETDKYMTDLQNQLMEKVKKLISDVAADQKISIVFVKSVIFYGGTDISQQVVEKGKKLAETAKPTPAPTKKK